jgi:integrase
LVDFFGTGKRLRDITAGDADAWRIWLAKQEGLAENTVRRRSGIAKQFFRAAVRRKLLVENPFADLAAAVRKNEKRHYFVSRDEAKKVLDACPDAQWRLLFALSRYGGLRCPSEHLGLRWHDVDWASARMTVHSPKTEHHEGGQSRQVPLFPELLSYLREVWEQAEPGAEHVITRYRDTNANLRTRLYKIIKRAGLKPWPKLFQNLRSTRETELAETYPIHVVCAWIGNTQAVAAKHYLQVTDAHFVQAATATPSALQNPVQALQNPVQQAAANDRTESHHPQKIREFAGVCDSVLGDTIGGVGGTGLEPVTSTV